MHHRLADLGAGRAAVEQKATRLQFQHGNQLGESLQVLRFGNQGRCELLANVA